MIRSSIDILNKKNMVCLFSFEQIMAERKAEEERLAMEKALRERRWRAAGHIQRFWQGYKVRKVNLN